MPELVTDEQLRARHGFVEAERDNGATFEQVGWTLAGMEQDQPRPHARDASVTDTDALLGALGYTADALAALRDEGVVA